MVNQSRSRRLTMIIGVAVMLAASVAGTVNAAAVPPKATSSVTFSNVSACAFDSEYKWSGFGGAGMSAYGIVAMYMREPGQADVLMDFSQQGDSPAGATPKSGDLLYRFTDERSWIISFHPSADARLVVTGSLITEKAHYGTIEIPEARAESTPLAIPAACLV
jgi:hypothetical protein